RLPVPSLFAREDAGVSIHVPMHEDLQAASPLGLRGGRDDIGRCSYDRRRCGGAAKEISPGLIWQSITLPILGRWCHNRFCSLPLTNIVKPSYPTRCPITISQSRPAGQPELPRCDRRPASLPPSLLPCSRSRPSSSGP